MRRGRSTALLALLLAGFGLAAGCRSLTTQPPPFLEDGGVFVLEDSLSESARQSARAHAAYATGIHHEVQKEPAAAETAYRAALAADPGNPAYALRVACVLSQQDRIADALEFAEGFVAAHPDSAAMECWLAEIYAKTREWDAALRHARAAAELAPREHRHWLAWANALKGASPDDSAAVREVLERGIEAAGTANSLRRMLLQILYADLEKLGEDPRDPAEAREICLAMVELARGIDREDPGDADTLRLLAALLFRSGVHEEGLKALERFLNVVGEEEIGNDNVATMAMQMTPPRELENLLGALHAMRERGETVSNGRFLEAQCLEALGRNEEALEAARLAVEENPGDENMWLWYFRLFEDDQVPTVFRLLKDALKANPESMRLHTLFAFSAFQMHRYALAERECLKVVAMSDRDPDFIPYIDLYSMLATIQTKSGKHEDAARSLLAGIAQKGNFGMLEDFAMSFYFSTDRNFRLAAKTLHALVGIAPTPATADAARAALAFACMSHGQPKNAVKEFDAIVAHYPDRLSVPARLQLMRAVALESAGRFDDACEALEYLILTQPNFTEPYNSLAYAWAVAGVNLDRALELAETAVFRAPGNAAYLDTLAWVQYRLGRYEEAWENIQRALAHAPGEEEILGHAKAIAEALEARKTPPEEAPEENPETPAE